MITRETNSMVEEFMLLANVSVAMHIRQRFPQFAVLRRHPSPPPSNYDPLVKAALSKVIVLFLFHCCLCACMHVCTALRQQYWRTADEHNSKGRHCTLGQIYMYNCQIIANYFWNSKRLFVIHGSSNPFFCICLILQGFSLSVGSNKELANSLEKAVLAEQPYFNTLLRILATRCMMQAVYFCSGSLPPEEYGHYGLAADIYTHFTSPIRR